MASKNTYDVVLEKVGNQPLMTSKILCGTLGLGLAAAKGLVDKAPATVTKGLDKDKALALKKELEDLGNTVSIPGMETKTEPLICYHWQCFYNLDLIDTKQIVAVILDYNEENERDQYNQ